MAVLLVLCHANDADKRASISAEIEKRHDTSVRLSDNAHALHTELLPVRVYDQLKDHLDPDDRLYVFPIRRPFTGYGPRAVTEWLSTYLPMRNGP